MNQLTCGRGSPVAMHNRFRMEPSCISTESGTMTISGVTAAMRRRREQWKKKKAELEGELSDSPLPHMY